MKTLLIIIILVFSINTAKSQLSGQAKIDSLLKELPKAKQDTNKVKLLISLGFLNYNINPDLGIKFTSEGLELSRKIKWISGEARCNNTLGILYNFGKSDFRKSIEYYEEALMINEELNNSDGIGTNLGNLGSVYNKLSEFGKALEYYLKALKIFEEMQDKQGIAINLANIGNIYATQKNYEKALEYYFQALEINNELKNDARISIILGNIGNVYALQKKYNSALEYYYRNLNLNETLGNKSGKALTLFLIGNIKSSNGEIDSALNYYQEALLINRSLGDKASIAATLGQIGNAFLKRAADSKMPSIKIDGITKEKKELIWESIKYLEESASIFSEIGMKSEEADVTLSLSKAYESVNNSQKALQFFKKFKDLQDSINLADNEIKIATLSATREKEVAEKELVIQKLQNIRQRNESYALWGGMAVFAVVLFVIYRQRKQSEKLLLNILPAAIAKRLKAKEHPIADHFESASVVFIDIVGFTSIASQKDSKQIVSSLNIIFTKFDEIASKHKLEKIKTIGDSYMAVTGVPIPDPNHAKNMAKFAIELKTEMHNYRTEDDTLIQFRIGIDFGEVVAGVIGEKKFIYDLWGDTVNTASRMESNGTPDEIQVTERFKLALENEFNFEERGELAIKGKGMMKTYYLKSEKN